MVSTWCQACALCWAGHDAAGLANCSPFTVAVKMWPEIRCGRQPHLSCPQPANSGPEICKTKAGWTNRRRGQSWRSTWSCCSAGLGWAGLESCSGGDWWNSPQSSMPPPCLHHTSAMRAIALLGLIILILQVTRLYSSTIILYAISIFLNKCYILNFSLMFQNADIYVKCMFNCRHFYSQVDTKRYERSHDLDKYEHWGHLKV